MTSRDRERLGFSERASMITVRAKGTFWRKEICQAGTEALHLVSWVTTTVAPKNKR